MKKFAPAIVLFIIGFVTTFIGAMFKIMHWPGANVLLIAGIVFDLLAGIAAIISLIKNRNAL